MISQTKSKIAKKSTRITKIFAVWTTTCAPVIRLYMPLKYIAVDGPIGVGKTTLAKMLSEDMGAKLVLEPVEENPFLADFYRNRQQNAFKTQIYFLLTRYEQQLALKHSETPSSVVCDYTIAKDSIFAKVNLSEKEESLYNTVFTLLKEKLPQPDIVIYLRADPKVIMQRIKKRGFDYERPITNAYLKELTDSYDRFFLNYTETPLLVVDTSKQNYIDNLEDFANLKRELLSHRGGTVHLIAR